MLQKQNNGIILINNFQVGDWVNHFKGEKLEAESKKLAKIAEDIYKKYNLL